MTRINLFELLVLVIFSDLSVATPPPMIGGGGSSSSSAAEQSGSRVHKLELFIVQGRPEGTSLYHNSKITVTTLKNDPTNFEYTLAAKNNECYFRNNGRNTEIVFYFGNKMKIHAKGNDDVVYSLDFVQPDAAGSLADRIIGLNSARYDKCEGSNSYNIESVYVKNSTTSSLFGMGVWCIFKIRKTSGTTFMIKRTSEMEQNRIVLGIFRKNEFSLTPVPGANNRFELRVSLCGTVLYPECVLETSTPERIQAFFKP